MSWKAAHATGKRDTRWQGVKGRIGGLASLRRPQHTVGCGGGVPCTHLSQAGNVLEDYLMSFCVYYLRIRIV